jgi:hypothetical protein
MPAFTPSAQPAMPGGPPGGRRSRRKHRRLTAVAIAAALGAAAGVVAPTAVAPAPASAFGITQVGGLDCFDLIFSGLGCDLSADNPYLDVPPVPDFVPTPVQTPPEPDPADPCDGMQDNPGAQAALIQNLTQLNKTDPFPSLEPPVSDLAACNPPPAPKPAYSGAQDVVLGDSYISGEGGSHFDTSKITAPNLLNSSGFCHDSLLNWPARAWNFPVPQKQNQVPYQNYACTGAVTNATSDPMHPSGGDDNNVENQIDQAVIDGGDPNVNSGTGFAGGRGLGPDTQAVQVSTGGNDLDFGPALKCAFIHRIFTPDAMKSENNSGVPCIPSPDVVRDRALNDVENLLQAWHDIADAAPNAVIEVATYPLIFDPHAENCNTGLTTADEFAANADYRTFDGIIRGAVNLARSELLNIRVISMDDALAHANACPDGRGNVHGVNVPGASMTPATVNFLKSYYHPNDIGQSAMRDTYSRLAAGGFFNFLSSLTSSLPSLANGSLAAEGSSDSVSIAAGGALLPVADQSELTSAGYSASSQVNVLEPDQFNGYSSVPVDGTLLRDAATGLVYQINSGQKIPVAGSPPGAVTVPDRDIAAIPDGSFNVAYQGANGDLFKSDGSPPGDQHVGLAAGTSPSVARLTGGGLVTTFQGSNGDLWLSGPVVSPGDQQIAMRPGSSPVVAGLAGGGYEVAYQGANGDLWTTGTAGGPTDWQLGMMNGTSPGITRMTGGGYETAITGNNNTLWVAGTVVTAYRGLSARTGSSPAITGLANNGFEIAFTAPNGDLTVDGSAGTADVGLGVSAGSRPSITTMLDGSWEVAVNGGGNLWVAGKDQTGWRQLGIKGSPSIVTLDGGQFEIAFTDPSGDLHVDGGDGTADLGPSPDPGTIPSITAAGGGNYQVAYSDGGDLWLAGPASGADQNLGVAPGTSPAMARLADGTQEMAIHTSTGVLWLDGPDANLAPAGASVATGTSPAVTGPDTGGFVAAWQGGNGDLWTYVPGGTPFDTTLGMAAGTSPTAAALPGGGWVIAFQAANGQLWLYSSDQAITGNQNVVLAPDTTPQVTVLGDGTPEVAYQGANGNLWLAGADAAGDQRQPMMAATSPAITTADGNWQVAFQSAAGSLWLGNPATGFTNWLIGMAPATSPAITGLSGGGYEVAVVESTSGKLWTTGATGNQPRGITIAPGTSPAITPAI